MVRYCLLLVTLLPWFILNSYAQSYPDVATKIHVSKLDSTAPGLHWRLWADQGWGTASIIQIDQGANDAFSGKIILYTTEAVDVEKEMPTGRVYSTVTAMPPAQASQIAGYINQNHINDIPTDRLIKGWTRGMDGSTYQIEYTEAYRYHQKFYWTPTARPELKEAVIIQKLIDTTRTILNLKTGVRLFCNQIPFESWSTGITNIKHIRGWLGRLRYKHERNAYRRRMHIEEKP